MTLADAGVRWGSAPDPGRSCHRVRAMGAHSAIASTPRASERRRAPSLALGLAGSRSRGGGVANRRSADPGSRGPDLPREPLQRSRVDGVGLALVRRTRRAGLQPRLPPVSGAGSACERSGHWPSWSRRCCSSVSRARPTAAAARWGAIWFALAALGDVWSGRVTFALGVSFALAAVAALMRAARRATTTGSRPWRSGWPRWPRRAAPSQARCWRSLPSHTRWSGAHRAARYCSEGPRWR